MSAKVLYDTLVAEFQTKIEQTVDVLGAGGAENYEKYREIVGSLAAYRDALYTIQTTFRKYTNVSNLED